MSRLPTSPSSAAPASTPSSRTPRSTPSTTPYGDPSAPVAVGTVAGRRVAFLPRHGRHHDFPPHRINYRANLWALRSLGVRQVLAPCAVGGLSPRGGARRPRGARPARRPHQRPGLVVRRARRGAPAVRRPLLPAGLRRAGRRRDPTSRRGGTMVVIEGPRFSTRAESQWYAAQGGTLINMTGAPEAALARELRMCYAALALVTDMDAGAEGGTGVGQEEVFALFRSNLERLTGLLTAAIAALPDPDGLHLLDLGRRHRAHLRVGAVRVLLTGSAGFIGTAVGEVARGGRPRGGPGRPDAADGARRGRAAGGHPPARRARRRGLGRPAARRRRGLPPGGGGRRRGARRRPARLRRPQRPRHRRAAGRDARGGRRPAGAGLLDGGLRRGPLPLPRARRPDAAAARGRGARGGRLREPLPALRPPAGLGAGRRGRAARPALVVRRQQGRPGALHLRVGAPGGRRERWRCATTTSTARGCRGTRRTPAWRRCSAPRSSAASRRRSSRTAARCATSCTWPTSPAPTSRRCGRWSTTRRRRTPPTTSPPGTRSGSSTWPRWWPRAPAAPSRPR